MQLQSIFAMMAISFVLAIAAPQEIQPTTVSLEITAQTSVETLVARQTTWATSDWAVKPSTWVTTSLPTSLTPTTLATKTAATTAPTTSAPPVGQELKHGIHRAVTSVPWWGWALGATGAISITAIVVFCLYCRNRGGKGSYEPAKSDDAAAPDAA